MEKQPVASILWSVAKCFIFSAVQQKRLQNSCDTNPAAAPPDLTMKRRHQSLSSPPRPAIGKSASSHVKMRRRQDLPRQASLLMKPTPDPPPLHVLHHGGEQEELTGVPASSLANDNKKLPKHSKKLREKQPKPLTIQHRAPLPLTAGHHGLRRQRGGEPATGSGRWSNSR